MNFLNLILIVPELLTLAMGSNSDDADASRQIVRPSEDHLCKVGVGNQPHVLCCYVKALVAIYEINYD